MNKPQKKDHPWRLTSSIKQPPFDIVDHKNYVRENINQRKKQGSNARKKLPK